MVKFLPLQENWMGNAQQTPLCLPLGRPSPPQQGVLWEVATLHSESDSESDPFSSVTLETVLDEIQEHSQVPFSFIKENQTGMQCAPPTGGVQDFSTYLEKGLFCNACAVQLGLAC